MNTYKVTILGSCEVGKSAIITRLCYDRFVEYYESTMENTFRKTVNFGDNEFILNISDTSGDEAFERYLDSLIHSSHGIIIVYSITNRKSFDKVVSINENVRNIHLDNNYPMLLVGNKSDLENERQISIEEGEELALSLKCFYLETSAKTGHNILDCFQDIIMSIQNSKEQKNVNNHKNTK